MHFVLLIQLLSNDHGEDHKQKDGQASHEVHRGDVHVHIKDHEGQRTGIIRVPECLSKEAIEPRDVSIHETRTELHVLEIGWEEKKCSNLESKNMRDYVPRIQRFRDSPESFDRILYKQDHDKESPDDFKEEVAMVFQVTSIKLSIFKIIRQSKLSRFRVIRKNHILGVLTHSETGMRVQR